MPSNSRSKSNQTMKSGQLIEYNKKNVFLKNIYTKCPVPDPFRNENWSNLWINSLKFTQLVSFVFLSWGLSKYIENKVLTTCFLKNKEVWKRFPSLILCKFLEEKYISCYTLLTNQTSLSDCLYFLKYWTNVYFNYLFLSLWHCKFGNQS